MNISKEQFDTIFNDLREKSYDEFSENIISITKKLKESNEYDFENFIMEILISQRASIDKMIYSLLSEVLNFSDNE